MGDTTTPPKALARALTDVQQFEGALKQCVTVPLAQHEYDALVSFSYNVGSRAFCQSTLVRKLNAEDYAGACAELLRWRFFQGKDCALPANAKILVYAPTFRDDHRMNVYNIDYQRVLYTLSEKDGGDWYVVVRLHPNLADKAGIVNYSDKVLNGTSYPIMNELIMGSDLLITDYSSVMFDAMEGRKKVVIYAEDIDQYVDDRGFYFDIRNLPFPVVENNDELISCLHSFDSESYEQAVRKFQEEVGLFSDGNASRRTVKYILKRIEYKDGTRG